MAAEQTFKIAIAYDWIYDQDFVDMLRAEAKRRGLRTLVVDERNLENILADIERSEIRINALLDRASDTSPHFVRLQKLLLTRDAVVIDPLKMINWASDKATMHLEFIAHGLNTPYTIILPPFDENEDIRLSSEDLACLGRPFIIKPANTTGGGIGVVEGAETLHDVLTTRREFKKDKYLLQENVHPMEHEGRRFWFRCIYTCGLINCLWWDDKTHIYAMLPPQQIEQFNLQSLFTITEEIAGICRLSFFSTEIALTTKGNFIVVDYVNESCDMRLQSRHADGVPDEIISHIVGRLITSMIQWGDK